MKKIFVCAVLAAASARPMLACDFCAIYAATEAQGESGKGFFGGVAEQFTYFDTFQSGGHDMPNPDAEHLSSSISQVFAGYNFNNRLSAQLNVPVIYREYAQSLAHGSDFGIGDISLLGNVRLFKTRMTDFTFYWNASAGLKLPTGDSKHLNPNENDFAAGIGGHDLALGSGSVDGLVGTDIFLRWRRIFLTASTQYSIRSEGDFGYQYANDLSWLGGPGVYLALEDNYTVALQAVVSGETKAQDTIHGAQLDDTAETAVYLGPQLNFTFSDRASAQLGADLPVSIVSTGDQLVPSWRVRAAVTFRF
jgi:hypothetical protein